MKFGKFTLAEDEILKSNWAAYAQSNDLSHEDILDYVGLSRTNVNCLGQSLRSIRKETDFYKKLG